MNKTYPECEKLDEHQEFIKNVLEFVEYANSQKVSLTKVVEHEEERPKNILGQDDETYTHKVSVHDTVNAENLLYEMLGIDAKKLEQERQALFDSLSS